MWTPPCTLTLRPLLPLLHVNAHRLPAEMLVSQLSDMRKRSDVAQMITGEYKRDLWYEDTYRTEDELVVSSA